MAVADTYPSLSVQVILDAYTGPCGCGSDQRPLAQEKELQSQVSLA